MRTNTLAISLNVTELDPYRHEHDYSFMHYGEPKAVSAGIQDPEATMPYTEYRARVIRIVRHGEEKRYALDKDAQQLVDTFVELETNELEAKIAEYRRHLNVMTQKRDHWEKMYKSAWLVKVLLWWRS